MSTTVGIDTSKAASVAASTNSTKSNNSLDKDAFLQLLVAQMQYQDPLEPTSNTEYMSQLAQFSSVEELQNINQTFAGNRALSLAGQYVILNVPNAAGKIDQVSGLVDYVTVNGGKTYFSINDTYYDSEYLDSVVSLNYLEYLSKTDNAEDASANQQSDEKTENDTVTGEGANQ